ncbi:MAG: type II toxin-antitoxin system VapC family toxin, partial [Alphaproteobacteria bacterium]|nr:type II toxin-antitoxin system VapC family toxin [Alphaproteobacteria bacterium]
SVLLMDDFHGDPADRIIVATTKMLGATLLTRDKKILDWAKDGHIKCLKS